ncbi:hypothetical protein [Streptomyces cirratus]|uniref:hypothetical protein n=1 Tax=Streptomyces cirratus TaxID=68187 RepID=UPI003609029E
MGIPTDPGTETGTASAGPESRTSRALTQLRTETGAAPAAARRAVRVTLAACVGFYTFLYVLDRPVPATYALFAAVSLAVLSRIPGTGRQRAAQMVRVLPVACVLVTLGTLLAVRTWAAVAGMLVVGFCLAFTAAAGPRQAGAAPGLQLLFILPCFPPYSPGDLGERLVGAVVGILLLTLAEAWVLPDPPVRSYRDRAAEAAEVAARCAAALAAPPYALPRAAAEEAVAAGEALRPSKSAEAERPAGPGIKERALAHTGLAARTLLARLHALPAVPADVTPLPDSLGLLRAVEGAARESARLLAATRPTGSARHGEEAAEAAPALRRARAEVAAALPRSPPTGAGRRACWRSPTPRWCCARPRTFPSGAAGPPSRSGTPGASGTPGCTRPGCGGTAWQPTPDRGPCTSRTPYGSPSRSRSPGPSRGWTPCRTASGPCSPCSA